MNFAKKYTYPLFETIAVLDGVILNIDYHQQRFKKSYKALYGEEPKYDLLTNINYHSKGLIKLRVFYNKTGVEYDYKPYNIKQIESLKTVFCDEIDYTLKYTNREQLNHLYNQKDSCDDVLIIKNGFITDTTIANIVFYYKDVILTPNTPLLKGTQRAYLLDKGIIQEEQIKLKDINKYKGFKLINAMRGLNSMKMLNIEHIL